MFIYPFYQLIQVSHLLKKVKACFFRCVQVFLDDTIDDLTFGKTQMHGLLICDTTAHVPTQLEYLGAYTLGLLFHALDGFNHPLGGQS